MGTDVTGMRGAGAARWVRPAAVAVVALPFLMLPVLLLTGSLRIPGLPPPDGIELLPDQRWWGNYSLLPLFVPGWKTALVNSTAVVAVAVPVTVLVGSLAGFSLVTGPRRLRALVLALVVVAIVVPSSALWVPRAVLFNVAGIDDTLFAVGASALVATSPFFVALFALAFSRVPKALFETALLEGSSSWATWWRIGLPLTRATVFAVAVLAFATHWGNLVEPLLYTTGPHTATLPAALRALQLGEPSNQPLLLAGAVLVTIPSLLVFLVAHRALLVRTVDG